MVIGRPWEDPTQRPSRAVDESGDPPDDDLLDDAIGGATGGQDELEPEHELRVGPGGIDDPETEWEIDETPDALPELEGDEIWLIVPGEQLQIVTALPKPRHLPMALAIRQGEIAVCSGRKRVWARTPVGASEEDADLPMAATVLVVFIRHRASGIKTRPRKYVIVVDEDEQPLGWLDYSDVWNFEGQILKQMVDAAGLAYEVERYQNEPEFEQAHQEWVG